MWAALTGQLHMQAVPLAPAISYTVQSEPDHCQVYAEMQTGGMI